MREVNQVFEQGLILGLRPERHLGPSVQYLMASMNMVPTDSGLEPRQEIANPIFDAPPVTTFPFPALYVLSRYILLFTETDLYLVNGNWEITHLFTHEWGDLPHIADFMDYIVISTPTGQWGLRGCQVTQMKGASFKTCTNFRGQLIVGDCSLPDGPMKMGEEVEESLTPVGGESTVAWSKIGSLDWEYTLGNEVGWAPMSWLGSVLGLLPLGKEVVVYGENGLCKMSMAKEPVTTFGIQDFGDIGVLNRNCFAGDTTAHLFVGTDYNLYAVTPEKALSGEGKLPSRLGYQEWIETLTNPIVSFDPSKRHWWIGDEKRCFIYTGSGLGESNETPTHLSRLDGSLLGLSVRHHPANAIVETGNISFDSRGIKTLMCVEGDLQASGKVYGSTRYRYSFNAAPSSSPKILLDPRGAFFPIVAGTEISVRLEAEDFRSFYLTKMWLHFKNTDKTFSRGVINAGRPAE